MSEIVLQAQALSKRFHEGRIDLTVLKDIDLQVRAGETLAIVGASGSGKSTLLHLLGGLDAPTSGTVQIKGQPLADLSPADQGALRNRQLGSDMDNPPRWMSLASTAMPGRLRFRISSAEARKIPSRSPIRAWGNMA